MTLDDTLYMRRALELAAHGHLGASPNPMVGCVVVDTASGRILGEGWHRRCGAPHAEVNAFASIAEADRPLIPNATVYVTLEPCSHWGRTPPCAEMLVREHPARVVVAMTDPFERVAGRGIARLREAAIEVTIGVLEEEAQRLNAKFITAHTRHRPYITLKWAESADGYIDGRPSPDAAPARISDARGAILCHSLRATHDAILVGSGTMLADSPRLDVRHCAGRSPHPYVADSRRRCTLPEGWTRVDAHDMPAMLAAMYADGITSLLVEGGARLLQSFLDAGLYDDIRREVNHALLLADMPCRTRAPRPKKLV